MDTVYQPFLQVILFHITPLKYILSLIYFYKSGKLGPIGF